MARPIKHRHPKPSVAFIEGFFEKYKTKRHMHVKYDLYHYFLPATLSPVLRSLKKYFRTLDSLSADSVPLKHRHRQTPFEFVETALNILERVRMRAAVNYPIYAGTEYFGPPIPWAVFGPNLQKRLPRLQFCNVNSILEYYGQYINPKGFNIIKIDRPHGMCPQQDVLLMFAERHQKSANFVLACSLMLLYDIIKNCGPDCEEFFEVFVNDKRIKTQSSYIEHWKQARSAAFPAKPIDFGELWVRGRRSHVLITSQKYNEPYHQPRKQPPIYQKNRKEPIYFDVEISDCFLSSHADLISGEKSHLFQSLFPKKLEKSSTKSQHAKWNKKPFNPYGYGLPEDGELNDDDDEPNADFHLCPDDVNDDEDEEIKQLDEEFQRIMSDTFTPFPHQVIPYNESIHDWAGL